MHCDTYFYIVAQHFGYNLLVDVLYKLTGLHVCNKIFLVFCLRLSQDS